MQYQIRLTVGDRWDDGHGKYEQIDVEINHHPDILAAAYRRAVKNSGIDFAHLFDDYQSRTLDDATLQHLMNLQVLPDAILADIEEYGFEGAYFDEYTLVNMYFHFVKTELVDLKWNLVPEDRVYTIDIGGYGLFE